MLLFFKLFDSLLEISLFAKCMAKHGREKLSSNYLDSKLHIFFEALEPKRKYLVNY